MPSPLFKARGTEGEGGSIIILSLFLIMSLLAVIALSIDSGNLYRARISMQKAADAAALSTVAWVVREGTEAINTAAGVTPTMSPADKQARLDTYLQPYAQRIALANMATSNMPDISATTIPAAQRRPVTVDGNYVPWNVAGGPVNDVFRYDVTLTRRVDYLLMDLLPVWAGGNTKDVTVTSSVIRKVVWTVVLLDISRSMACPAIGACTCTSLARTGPCPATGSKFNTLMGGLRAFLETFDLERDQIILVPFNIKAEAVTVAEAVEQARDIMSNPSLPASSDTIVNFVENVYRPSGMTNLCDGLVSGYTKLRSLLDSVAIPGNEHIEWVVFSDGAPTAGRYLFDDLKAGGNMPAWRMGSDRDYIFHNVEWVDDDNSSIVGPSLLTQHGAYPIQYQDKNFLTSPPPPSADNDFATTVSCTGGPTTAPPVDSAATKQTASNQVFGSCLNSLRSHLPGRPLLQYGGDYVASTGANYPSFVNFAEMHYNCAVMMSDLARAGPYGSTRGQGRFSVIGVGDPAPATVSPYQNAEEAETRHDVFLARLALDKAQSDGIPVYTAVPLAVPPFAFRGYTGFDEAIGANPDLQGQYYPRPNVGELRNLFRTIARKVALRYIQ